jgi:hypothetical protein
VHIDNETLDGVEWLLILLCRVILIAATAHRTDSFDGRYVTLIGRLDWHETGVDRVVSGG